MLLDIIITHYKEPFEKTGRKLFDSIEMQRGISLSDFRVILVNDGKENAIPDEALRGYHFAIVNRAIEHAGVSAARNHGIDYSTADWVMFCDFDDMFASIYALRNIITLLKKDEIEQIDMLWSPFYVENSHIRDTDQYAVMLQGQNLIWIHGRVYRREMLNREHMRFDERLYYGEDSAFNAVLNEIVPFERVGKILSEAPLYLWCYQENSVTTNKANLGRNAVGHILRNLSVTEEFIQRGIDATSMVGRMFWDAYCGTHRRGEDPEIVDRMEEFFAPIAEKYEETYQRVNKTELAMVRAAAMRGIKGPENIAGDETMEEWINRITGGKASGGGGGGKTE